MNKSETAPPTLCMQIRQATITQIADTIGASASFASSALSGNVRAVAVGLYEEIEP